jgi:hypothetical protein
VAEVKEVNKLYRPHCGCGKSWTGTARCHCGSCHETFTGLSAFEKHRVTVNQSQALRECAPPASVGLVQNDHGYWGSPDSDTRWSHE